MAISRPNGPKIQKISRLNGPKIRRLDGVKNILPSIIAGISTVFFCPVRESASSSGVEATIKVWAKDELSGCGAVRL